MGEVDAPAVGAAPRAVGVAGKDAVPTAPVHAAVGHGHLDHPRVRGSIQQSLHRHGVRARATTHRYIWLARPPQPLPKGLPSCSRAPHFLTAHA